METVNSIKYLLAIKRGNNDYLPLEWSRSNLYDGEDLNSLEGIDQFTSKFTETELLQNGLDLGFIELDDRFMNFSIIYYENGKLRELKEGCIFINKPVLDDDGFIDTVVNYATDKEIINNIINFFNKRFASVEAQQFVLVLRNIGLFYERGENYLRLGLDVFRRMPYEERRRIRVCVSNMFLNKISKNSLSYKKNNVNKPVDDII